MKILKINLLLIALLISCISVGQTKSFYDFKANTIDGKSFDFSSLKGKKVLIVNIATECSLTPQLKKLQELYEEYGGEEFEIIAFPCNDFGKQEPGESKEIKEFCSKKYAVSFRLMEKISIKGENPHPIYNWLTNSKENGTLDSKVTWNYQKFLINKNGEIFDSYSPLTSPKNSKIVEWLRE